MGNCQAVDTATLVIQHPNGKVERLYWPVSASEVMRTNPGHHVALVLTVCLPPHSSSNNNNKHREDKEKDKQESQHQQERPTTTTNNNNNEVRITRVKVLRPTDTLVLGQAYRLVTSQEVMKGLWARKHAKMKKDHDTQSTNKPLRRRPKQQVSSSCETESTSSHLDKPNQLHVAKQRHRPRTASATSASTRSWRPSLQSISEAGS